MISQKEYVLKTIQDLIEYSGEVLVFETFIEVWGLDAVYQTTAQIISQLEMPEEELQSEGIDTDGGTSEEESGDAD